MQQRRSAAGRPTGTDGSDFSYRMVVDSRYTRVATGKSRLWLLLIIQAIILVATTLFISFPMLNGDGPEVISLSAAAISLIALLVGESGRKHSKLNFLKVYIVLSTVSMVLFLSCTIDRKVISQLVEGQISSSWERQKVQLIKALLVLVGSLVQIVIISTTVSLISDMSPPKRSS